MSLPFYSVIYHKLNWKKKSTKYEIKGELQLPAFRKLSQGIPYMAMLSVHMQHELTEEYM